MGTWRLLRRYAPLPSSAVGWVIQGPVVSSDLASRLQIPAGTYGLPLCLRTHLTGGGELVLINTHNSAYDDGSLKKAQMEQLKVVLVEEAAKGNFVIVGGDWNQFPAGFEGFPGIPTYNLGQADPRGQGMAGGGTDGTAASFGCTWTRRSICRW